MINKNELRIGNKIKHTNHILTVSELRNRGYVCVEEGIDGYLDEYEPIPITPEILEKAGFKDVAGNKLGYRLYLNSTDELCYYVTDDSLRYQTRGSGFTRDFNTQYLHQLQNLYFALTGTELEINL